MADRGLSRRGLLGLLGRPFQAARQPAPEPAPTQTPARPPANGPPTAPVVPAVAPAVRPPHGAPPPPPLPLRPPSAGSEDDIAASCLRCGACVEACPRGAIRPLPALYGARAGTPHIVARHAPCVLCDGLQCTHVCPSGTLRPLPGPAPATHVRMGLAAVASERCLPYQGKPCSQCHDKCPIAGAIALDPAGRPRVTDACTGCGMCEYYCPVTPAAIRVTPHGARAPRGGPS